MEVLPWTISNYLHNYTYLPFATRHELICVVFPFLKRVILICLYRLVVLYLTYATVQCVSLTMRNEVIMTSFVSLTYTYMQRKHSKLSTATTIGPKAVDGGGGGIYTNT